MKNVAGLDLSMTAPGLCHTVNGAPCWHLIKPKGAGDERLVSIRNEVRSFLEEQPPVELVLMEGYLNHSHSAGITGMVHGAVRSMLLEYNYRYATIPPTSLKKFATGRGGASKTDMALAAYKRGGVEFTDDNTCDAYWAWAAANEYLGQPVFDLPQVQREALKAVKLET